MMDPIADMLTRIRNAQKAGMAEVQIAASKLKLAVAKIMEQEGFLDSVMLESDKNGGKIKIGLKYFRVSNTKRVPAINQARRISRQGQRVYVRNKEIKSVRNKFGIAILSTPQGVMTGEAAKKGGLGGEYICEIW